MGCTASSRQYASPLERFDENEDLFLADRPVVRHDKSKARGAVFTPGLKKRTSPTSPPTRVEKTDREKRVLLNGLSRCYMFDDMPERTKVELLSYFVSERIRTGTSIVNQGKKNDKFYIIENGQFDITVDGKIQSMRSGIGNEPFFCESALMFDAKAVSTVKCVSSNNGDSIPAVGSKYATVWVVSRDTYRQMVASHMVNNLDEFRAAVDAIPMLREFLTVEQREKVAEAMEIINVKAKKTIVHKGDPGDVCYFIHKGQVDCTNIGDQGLGKITLGPGSFFGERSLLRDEPRAADVTTTTDCVLWVLQKKSFNKLLGPLQNLMDENIKSRVVECVPILQQLPSKLRERVLQEFKLVHFKANETIVREGDRADTFFIVRSGIVDIYKNQLQARAYENESESSSLDDDGSVSLNSSPTNSAGRRSTKFFPRILRKSSRSDCRPAKLDAQLVATLREGDWFGEIALLNDSPRTATCIAATPVECFALSYTVFKLFKGKSEILEMISDKRFQEIQSQNRDPGSKNLHDCLTLSHITKEGVLGKGTFGTVYLAQSLNKSPVKGVWALKQMNKAHIVQSEQTQNVINEKTILLQLSHPFILNLLTTFQDKNNIYMLLEFVQGGELFSIMRKHLRLPLEHVRFYSACVVDAFEYMHSKDVVYRDLKPENLLIDSSGYVKIADFGFAKKLKGKTFTLCGTPEYLAPEVIVGKGHGKGVDYWAIGVLIYEMVVGMSPFADSYDNDPTEICKNIISSKMDSTRLFASIQETRMNPPSKMSLTQVNYAFPQNNKLETLPVEGLDCPTTDLVERLLYKSPKQRIGCLRDGARDIKKHPFFNMSPNMWIQLTKKNVTAPWKPAINGKTDTSSFEKFSEDQFIREYNGSSDWCQCF